jgi:hypothetical protein
MVCPWYDYARESIIYQAAFNMSEYLEQLQGSMPNLPDPTSYALYVEYRSFRALTGRAWVRKLWSSPQT